MIRAFQSKGFIPAGHPRPKDHHPRTKLVDLYATDWVDYSREYPIKKDNPTEQDLAAIARAEAKRERKRLRRATA